MKVRIIVLVIALISLFGYYLIYINNNVYALWNSNEIKVWTGKSYESNKVKIEFGISATSINRKNDLELLEHRDDFKVVYENGENQSPIYNEYGENDFIITYDDKYYISFRHFKFSRHQQHDYSFGFYWKDGGLNTSVNIDGDSPMYFEHKMIPIDSASFYCCNKLIKK